MDETLPSPCASLLSVAEAFGVSWSARVADTTPKCIDREGLGRHRTWTTQEGTSIPGFISVNLIPNMFYTLFA